VAARAEDDTPKSRAAQAAARRVILHNAQGGAERTETRAECILPAALRHARVMEAVEEAVTAWGGAARVAALLRSGFTRGAVTGAIARGRLVRVRRGWVASRDAPAEVLRCVEAGGRLGCVSAAAHLGLWTPAEPAVHVAIPRHSGRIELPLAPGLIPHWLSANWRSNPSVVENIVDVIRQVILCRDRETAICVIESAMHSKLISLREVTRLIDRLPARYRSIRSELDAAAESGLESVCRIRFRALGLEVRGQVAIDGIGRVDLLFGERLIVETDGETWHSGIQAFERDRARDLALLMRGYLVVRVSYMMVTTQWPLVELAVMALVARGEHRWSARHIREGLGR